MTDRHNRARTRYASDDYAGDLLADILDSTEEDARREEAELHESISARVEAAKQEKLEEQERKITERRAKLRTELERQATLARRRTLRMEALNAPEVEEEAPVLEQTPVLDEAAIRRQIADEVRQELRAVMQTPAPITVLTPQRSSNTGLLVAAAGVLMACGIGLTAFVASPGYSPDPTSYAKSVFAPTSHDAVALEMHAVPVPTDVAVASPTPKEVRRKKPTQVRGVTPKPAKTEAKSAFGKPSGKSDARKSFETLSSMLDDDVLGLDKK